MNDTPLYNSSIIDTYVKMIKSRYSYVNVPELLNYAGMTAYQVADQGHWFTQDQVNRFYDRLHALTGNDHIAREAGRYAASPDSMGVMRQYFLGLVGPAKAYELIGEAARNIVRSCSYTTRKLAFNRVEITVTPRSGVRERSFQCENRIGFFESISTLFSGNLPHIEHPQCVFRGDSACRYMVSWEPTSNGFWQRLRNGAALVLLLVTLVSLAISPYPALTLVAPASLTLVLLLTICALKSEMTALSFSQQNLKDLSDNLFRQMEKDYNNALAANEIGQVISKETGVDQILARAVQILENRLDY
ncbi:MAG TPA: phosphohydrolase, partial [Geomonas sp.]|nr:phosphohydrolase [Geomonas sp.]